MADNAYILEGSPSRQKCCAARFHIEDVSSTEMAVWLAGWDGVKRWTSSGGLVSEYSAYKSTLIVRVSDSTIWSMGSPSNYLTPDTIIRRNSSGVWTEYTLPSLPEYPTWTATDVMCMSFVSETCGYAKITYRESGNIHYWIMEWNGSSWSTLPYDAIASNRMYGQGKIHALDENNLLVCGYGNNAPHAIFTYNGTSWSYADYTNAAQIPIWATSNSYIWTSDYASPSVKFYNGVDFTTYTPIPGTYFTGILGKAVGDILFTYQTKSAHWDGASWVTATIPYSIDYSQNPVLYNGDYYVVSTGGKLMKYSAGAWSVVASTGAYPYQHAMGDYSPDGNYSLTALSMQVGPKQGLWKGDPSRRF